MIIVRIRTFRIIGCPTQNPLFPSSQLSPPSSLHACPLLHLTLPSFPSCLLNYISLSFILFTEASILMYVYSSLKYVIFCFILNIRAVGVYA